MRPAAVVVAVAIAATLAWIVAGLASEGSRLAGTNSTLLGSYVATIPPRERLCQSGEAVPANAAALEVFTGVFGKPGPPLRLTIGGRAAGALDGGFSDGWARIPLAGELEARKSALEGQRICIRNGGPGRLALGGLNDAPQRAAQVAGEPADGRISMRWTAAERGTWWSQAATIARRTTVGKADLGPWVPALLIAVVWAGAFGLVLRSGP